MTKEKLKIFFRQYNYLLIAAAWFITISFIIDNYWSDTATSGSVKKAIEKDIQNKQADFKTLYTNIALVKSLASGQLDPSILEKSIGKEHFIFIFQSRQFTPDEALYWNTQTVEPNVDSLHIYKNNTLIKFPNGWYVYNIAPIAGRDSQGLKVVSLIPVKWEYYVQNKYLENTFVASKNIERQYDISPGKTKISINDANGKPLFYLQAKSFNLISHNNIFSLWLRILASLLILFFIHTFANFVLINKNLWWGIVALVVPVILLRTLTYFLPIPLNFRQFDLFDPTIYASSAILRSLGDLLINTLLIVWLVLFLRYHLQEVPLRLKASISKPSAGKIR